MESIPLGPWLDALNAALVAHIGRDARNLQIAHAYLLDNGEPVTTFARLARIIQADILPLLEEYWYLLSSHVISRPQAEKSLRHKGCNSSRKISPRPKARRNDIF